MKQISQRQTLISDYAKAVSHPIRVAILEMIEQAGELSFGAIFDQLPLAKATVSQHITELKNAGLIVARSEGARVFYSIDAETWRMARVLMGDFFGGIVPEE